MSKKIRRFFIVLAAAVAGVYAGFHLGTGGSSAALADRDQRLRNLYALWSTMCVMDPDHALEKADCDAAWEHAQTNRR